LLFWICGKACRTASSTACRTTAFTLVRFFGTDIVVFCGIRNGMWLSSIIHFSSVGYSVESCLFCALTSPAGLSTKIRCLTYSGSIIGCGDTLRISPAAGAIVSKQPSCLSRLHNNRLLSFLLFFWLCLFLLIVVTRTRGVVNHGFPYI
jgi:hypothetical protein